MAVKEYKCVKKTKRTLQNSLIELSKETPLNKISVKHICEKSELSRNAFYFHYDDINALIKEIEDSMIEDIKTMFSSIEENDIDDNLYTIINGMTNYFIDHRDAALMLMESTYSTSFTKRIDEAFSDFYYVYYKKYNPNGSKEVFDFFYGFVSKGFSGMLIQWLHDPENISKRHFIRLAYIFVHKLLTRE